MNVGGDCCINLAMLQAAEGALGDVGSDSTFRWMIADFATTPASTRPCRRCDPVGPHEGVGRSRLVRSGLAGDGNAMRSARDMFASCDLAVDMAQPIHPYQVARHT